MAINVEMPFWRAKQQMAQYAASMPINQPIREEDKEPPEPPNVLVDAVSLGGPGDPKQKPLVRHVIVKDLNKIGTRMKLEHPKTGVFRDKAPMGLYALFDGQSCAGDPGPMAAEFCARNFHTKLLERLANLPPAGTDKASVEVALRGTFEDLDRELMAGQPELQDGCGAAVALLVGDHIFVATLGRCSALLGEVEEGGRCVAAMLGGGQRQFNDDLRRLRVAGGMFIHGEGSAARIRHPRGALSAVSRSLGDRSWKGAKGGGSGPPLVVCTPEVRGVQLKGCDEHPFLLLTASSVAMALSPQQLVDIAAEFRAQPRAACGEIVNRSLEARAGAAALAQCTTVEIAFLPSRDPGEDDRKRALGAVGPSPPPPKKARNAAPGGDTQSMRLRHIMLRYQDGPPSKDAAAKGGKALRTRQEAETVLRRAIGELRQDLKSAKKAPKDANEVVAVTSKKFMELCRELSECETAHKGGNTCGDLGWVSPETARSMGGSFKEVASVLLPGQLSDIAASETGLHLIQRIA